MRAIDTNILVRYIVRDDPAQAAAADEILKEECFVSTTVLMETVWLLTSRYKLTRHEIALVLTEFLRLPAVRTNDDALTAWAIDRFDSGADFADMAHLIAAHVANSFLTFDRRLARYAGTDTPIPIETLT